MYCADAGLRDRLNRIMSSHYFIRKPEMKAPVDMAAFQVPVQRVPISVPVQVDSSSEQYQEVHVHYLCHL